MRKLLVASLLLTASETWAGPCDAIISHGLRNISISYSSDVLNASKYERACKYDMNSMSDSTLANLEVEVFGYGSGSGGFDRTRTEERITSWCNENRASSQTNRQQVAESQTIYQGAVDAWQSCIALNTKDIRITPTISGDARTVDIAIYYAGLPSEAAILSGVQADGFTCQTTARPRSNPTENDTATFPIALNTAAVQVHCERENEQEVAAGDQIYQRLPRGTISIQTTSDPFQLFFAEEYSPAAPVSETQRLTQLVERSTVPVGTVITSTLAPEVFLSEPAHQGVWVLANGDPAPAGSAYQRISGQANVPDLRSMNQSRVLVDSVAAAAQSGQMLSSFIPAESIAAQWFWMYSLRDIEGNRVNRDYEQDVDNFQVLESNGAVIAQGRTQNFKQIGWASWRAGQANIFGLGYLNNPFYYYVKVN